jgi:hypothetical protein
MKTLKPAAEPVEKAKRNQTEIPLSQASALRQGLLENALRRHLLDQLASAESKAPKAMAKLLADAQLAKEGRLILPSTGGEPYFVGSPPDWYLDPFSDDQTAGELNRMQHWPVLVRAGVLTGDDSYHKRVVGELADWLERCPCPMPEGGTSFSYNFRGPGPWRLLDAGIRMYSSWPVVLLILADRPDLLDDELLLRAFRSCADHAQILAACTPVDSENNPTNHEVMEFLGLLYVCALFPEIPESRSFRDLATRALERSLERQVSPSGAQIEGCPHYHNLCFDFFARAMWLVESMGDNVSAAYRNRLQAMVDYSLHTTRASGRSVPWGDSDALFLQGRVALWGCRLWKDFRASSLFASILGEVGWNDVCQEHYWEIVPAYSVDWFAPPVDVAEMPVLAFMDPIVKQAALRTSWSGSAASVFLGCQTPVYNAHAHADPGGFDFTAMGRTILCDPARYTYAEGEERRNFKSAKWHNTLVLNDEEPFEYIDSWSYGPQGNGGMGGLASGSDILAASCEHHCYAPVVHRRLIALLDERKLLVIDWLLNLKPTDAWQIYFHFDSTELAWDSKKKLASAEFGSVRARLASDPRGRAKILPGACSDVIDQKRETKRLCLFFTPVSPRPVETIATVITVAPCDETEKPLPHIVTTADADSCVITIREESHSRRVHWTGEGITLR